MSQVVNPFIGRCLGGDFDILRPIASGGVGSVFEATQRSTGKSRAVKVMHAWLLRDDRMRARFLDEARIAGSVESDHVVEVVSAGIDPDLDAPWIAMELLRGRTLTEQIDQFGPMSAHDALEVMLQAQHGLQLSHQRNLVHRDLKPDNVFVAEARRPGVPFTIKVLDFGIAKWVHDAREGNQNSQIIGTPSWMAPEQLSHVARITPATDVWALGLLAFWTLTGREYWLASNDEHINVSSILLEMVSGANTPASARARELGTGVQLSEAFDAWFSIALALDPNERFTDAASCVEALIPILDIVPRPQTKRTITGDPARAVVPATEELDDAFEKVFTSAARTYAHAETTAISPAASVVSSGSINRRATAHRLETNDLTNAFLLDSSLIDPMLPLLALLGEALAPALPRDIATSSGPRGIPDRVGEAVRHADFVLRQSQPTALLASPKPAPAFVVGRIDPPTLLVSPDIREESSIESLHAHAAVGVGRTSTSLLALALFDSKEALDSARKAAAALARGSVSSSPLFRKIVGVLGPKRAQLVEACDRAASISSDAHWSEAVRSLSRAAFIVSADAEATLVAMSKAGLAPAGGSLRVDLKSFASDEAFRSYWRDSSP